VGVAVGLGVGVGVGSRVGVGVGVGAVQLIVKGALITVPLEPQAIGWGLLSVHPAGSEVLPWTGRLPLSSWVILRLWPITRQPDLPKILSEEYGGQVQLLKSKESPGCSVATSPVQPAVPVSPAQATMIVPPGQLVAVNLPVMPRQ
jgi:hypothetical protein